jgi:hypothetical protein
MQNIPFSEPPALFRKRQIPLNGTSARILVVDDRPANAEALAASLVSPSGIKEPGISGI